MQQAIVRPPPFDESFDTDFLKQVLEDIFEEGDNTTQNYLAFMAEGSEQPLDYELGREILRPLFMARPLSGHTFSFSPSAAATQRVASTLERQDMSAEDHRKSSPKHRPSQQQQQRERRQ